MPSTVFQKQAPDSPSLVSNDNNSAPRDGSSKSIIQDGTLPIYDERKKSQPNRSANNLISNEKKEDEDLPTSPPSGNPFNQFLNETNVQPFKTSLVRD